MTDQPNERPPLELIALAAWVNCDPDVLPASMRAPTCEATMAAWKRVADALFVRFEQDTADRVRELEGALRKIASCESHAPGDVVDIARATLTRSITDAAQ